MKAGLTNIFVSMILMVYSSVGKSALPPGSYQKLMEEAEEELTIFVCNVNSSYTNKTSYINAEAVITDVDRSSSNLENEQIIKIQYQIHRGMILGPKEAFTLESGQKYHAYLRQVHEYYTLAAYGMSFINIESEGQEIQESCP